MTIESVKQTHSSVMVLFTISSEYWRSVLQNMEDLPSCGGTVDESFNKDIEESFSYILLLLPLRGR